jgi:hypothetical protein
MRPRKFSHCTQERCPEVRYITGVQVVVPTPETTASVNGARVKQRFPPTHRSMLVPHNETSWGVSRQRSDGR